MKQLLHDFYNDFRDYTWNQIPFCSVFFFYFKAIKGNKKITQFIGKNIQDMYVDQILKQS